MSSAACPASHAVYRLHGPPTARTRVAAPAQLLRAEAEYSQRLIDWLRSQARWVPQTELLHAVPQPAGAHAETLARLCLDAHPDAVATCYRWRAFAAWRNGALPGAVPTEAQARQLEQTWAATLRQRAGGCEAEAGHTTTPQQAALPHAAASAPLSPDAASAPAADAAPDSANAGAPLRATAAAALQANAGALRLSVLARELARAAAASGAPQSSEALHAALAAAPETFQLVPQFVGGAPFTVYLLDRATGRRVAPPPAATPEARAYLARLLAWLRREARWCALEEALKAVPPPVARAQHTYARVHARQHADDIATTHSMRHLAALRDGQPPGPPPTLAPTVLRESSSPQPA
jgi:hypothetical protein